ncbi:hypothetical protein ACOMHN_024800 [Nucella lapillus]
MDDGIPEKENNGGKSNWTSKRTLTAVGYPDWTHLLPNLQHLPNLTAVDLSRSQVSSLANVVYLSAQYCRSLERLV